jgi:hypothetical protein
MDSLNQTVASESDAPSFLMVSIGGIPSGFIALRVGNTHTSVLVPASFESHRSYWAFALSIRRAWRFFRGDQESFLAAVSDSLESRAEVIPKGMLVWRAQLGNTWRSVQMGEDYYDEIPAAYSAERMRPFSDRAVEGRVNPKGMPCFYAASHRDTAVAEMRPWVGAYVSVAQFEIVRDLKAVNCTNDDGRFVIYMSEPPPKEREEANWREINRAFSRPVSPADDNADYAPTQVLAELFRREGFEAIAYGSSVGVGHNLALFDLDAAKMRNCQLVRVDKVKLEYSEADNPYFVK